MLQFGDSDAFIKSTGSDPIGIAPRRRGAKLYVMTSTYSPIVKCNVHQCEHTERTGCLLCSAEIESARQRAEDDTAVTDTRVDVVDLMLRVASHRTEVGTSSWLVRR